MLTDRDRLTSEQYAEDDIDGLPELCETINLQTTGPREASRALRKKLKYGNTHRQLRSLTVCHDGYLVSIISSLDTESTR